MSSFTPFKKTATNVAALLKDVAKDRSLTPQEVDFEILKVETLIKSPKHKEWSSTKLPLEKEFEQKLLRSQLVEVRQEYELYIKPYQERPILAKVTMDILSNKTKSKAIVVFKKGSIFPKTKELAKEIRNAIYRQKLRLGYILQHFEPNLNANILKFAKMIVADQALQKDIKFPISVAVEPLLQIDDNIIFHYKNKPKKDKSLITGVDCDDLVFEYIKPKRGRDGRGCSGNHIVIAEPQLRYRGYVPDPKTIKIIEDDASIKYYAKIDGYFKEEQGVIKISQEMALQSASFKRTGSINADNNQDISINIAKGHHSNDAVGSGVHIDVKEVNIEGTVGASSSVKAVELSVGEQTHRNSKLEAVENAKVKLHRGNLKAKTAQIDILENGTVQADEIHVNKMLGGEIIGKNIFVNELTSNTVVIASESIEIEAISGEHNRLIIDPNKIDSYHQEILTLKEDIKKKEQEYKRSQEELQSQTLVHQELLPRIKTFQKRVLTATKAQRAPNKSDLIRVKQYKRDALKLQEQSRELQHEEQRLQESQERLEKFDAAELHAQIIYHGEYNGHTKVIFVDTKTDEEYFMVPQGKHEIISLTKVDDEKKIVC